jgi:hypothetical protein
MATPYEKIVAEDLNLGLPGETVQVTMPGGGTATGSKIGLHTFQETVGQAFAALPAASLAKGQLRWVNDSTTTTAGAVITGGGANFVLAGSNGTNWKVAMG